MTCNKGTNQNQGARVGSRTHAHKRGTAENIALSFIRTMTVDPGIAPDLLTLIQARPEPGARGLMQLPAITAGGEFHPALRTLSRRNGRNLAILERDHARFSPHAHRAGFISRQSHARPNGFGFEACGC